MDLLGQMSWPQWFLAVFMVGVCILLMIVILLQKGRGGGLSGAFGGVGGTAAFGAKTGDVFTWITVVVATLFVLLAVVTNFAFDESVGPRVQTTTADEEAGDEALPISVEGTTTDGEVVPITVQDVETEPVSPVAPSEEEAESGVEGEGTQSVPSDEGETGAGTSGEVGRAGPSGTQPDAASEGDSSSSATDPAVNGDQDKPSP